MFNAILIIVSHVVDPDYVGDRNALGHLDQAVQMIRQMSANHLCAQRAYSFLQQLLVLLDKTMPEGHQRNVEYRSSGGELTGGGDPGPVYPAPYLGGMVLGVAPDFTGQADTLDLWSFLDSTQDLTTDLGSQLRLHSTLGSAMWSWGSTEPPPIHSPSIMSGVMHSS